MVDLPVWQWCLAIMCAMLIGFSKTGIGGLGAVTIPIMAMIFGGRASSGIILPMLIFGDIIAVRRYREHTEWSHILKLLPWAFTGIIVGTVVGKDISDDLFRKIIGVIIISGLITMIYREKYGQDSLIVHNKAFVAAIGILGGFATMIGNAAGPIMAVYLLSTRLPKLAYIGTGAWYFMIVNVSKVPFQIYFWQGITFKTFAFNLALLPALLLGAYIGLKAIKKIPEKEFRRITIVITALATLKLFF